MSRNRGPISSDSTAEYRDADGNVVHVCDRNCRHNRWWEDDAVGEGQDSESDG